jgi:hypothetical protein
MTLAEAQQHRLLELLLHEAGEEPVGFTRLHCGISLPAAGISELALTDTNRARLDHGHLGGVRCSIQAPWDAPAASDGAGEGGAGTSRPWRLASCQAVGP